MKAEELKLLRERRDRVERNLLKISVVIEWCEKRRNVLTKGLALNEEERLLKELDELDAAISEGERIDLAKRDGNYTRGRQAAGRLSEWEARRNVPGSPTESGSEKLSQQNQKQETNEYRRDK